MYYNVHTCMRFLSYSVVRDFNDHFFHSLVGIKWPSFHRVSNRLESIISQLQFTMSCIFSLTEGKLMEILRGCVGIRTLETVMGMETMIPTETLEIITAIV